MKLIVGLGNPGKKYEKTRHNVGFMILDALREKLKADGMPEWSLSTKFNAETAGATINSNKIVLAKPMTFMNASGESVGLIAHFYKLTPRDLIVVHDEKDLLLGDVRMERNRSSAGHNGVQSIIDHLGTKDFIRIRVGIASENKKKMGNTPKFVLGKFGVFEKKKVKESVDMAVNFILKELEKKQ